ncbi:slipin family protein [Myxococcota bacterium]|nr:slipin family protein [Myxococcota bacterium]MBU1383044.1 slipin family protein [Myxococcota bacterium]MBU1497552.1 slipin family protein [Myxococcota bacterium]
MELKLNEFAMIVKKGKYIGCARKKFAVPLFCTTEIFDQEQEFFPTLEKLRYLKDLSFMSKELDFYEIRENQVGLYYLNSKPARLIRTGEYGFLRGMAKHRIEVYDVEKEFIPKQDKLEFIKDLEFLQDEISIVEIKDNEIGVHFVGGHFRDILTSGTHAFWKSRLDHEIKIMDFNEITIDKSLESMEIFSELVRRNLISAFTVESWAVGLLMIDGQIVTILEPGVYYYWKYLKKVNVINVDLRQQTLDISGQEILSKDRVAVRINFVAIYRIIDVMKSMVRVNDFKAQLYTVFQLVLREYIGSLNFDDILAKKEEIGTFVNERMKSHAEELGCEIVFSGIKDIILPGEIRDIMNQVLVAEKRAQANVIMRREETASTRSLMNTAKLLEENKILYHLKELEYIEKISERLTQVSINGGSTHILDEFRRMFIPPKP